MPSSRPLVLTLALFTATSVRAELPTPVDLEQLATTVAGREIRIEVQNERTLVTTEAEEKYILDEPAQSVAAQVCGDHRRAYDLGRGEFTICTARTAE